MNRYLKTNTKSSSSQKTFKNKEQQPYGYAVFDKIRKRKVVKSQNRNFVERVKKEQMPNSQKEIGEVTSPTLNLKRLSSSKQNNSVSHRSKPPKVSCYFQQSTSTPEEEIKIDQNSGKPNRQYFGSKIATREYLMDKPAQKQTFNLKLNEQNLIAQKIRQLRKVENLHESQYRLLVPWLNTRQHRRLQKIHSTQRIQLMEQIITLEQRSMSKWKKR